eukprot:Rhum_TRINITY_DN14286_c0_g1::Rhum_TRINITY_DN14286_c0_g1_i1::g.76658::m.76658
MALVVERSASSHRVSSHRTESWIQNVSLGEMVVSEGGSAAPGILSATPSEAHATGAPAGAVPTRAVPRAGGRGARVTIVPPAGRASSVSGDRSLTVGRRLTVPVTGPPRGLRKTAVASAEAAGRGGRGLSLPLKAAPPPPPRLSAGAAGLGRGRPPPSPQLLTPASALTPRARVVRADILSAYARGGRRGSLGGTSARSVSPDPRVIVAHGHDDSSVGQAAAAAAAAAAVRPTTPNRAASPTAMSAAESLAHTTEDPWRAHVSVPSEGGASPAHSFRRGSSGMQRSLSEAGGGGGGPETPSRGIVSSRSQSTMQFMRLCSQRAIQKYFPARGNAEGAALVLLSGAVAAAAAAATLAEAAAAAEAEEEVAVAVALAEAAAA